MAHNDSGKSQFALPLPSWPEEGEMQPCTFPEMHPEDMKCCLLGPRAFVLQALLRLQGRAEEGLVHPPLLTRMALPPTRPWEILVSRCPMGTAELKIREHNGVTQDQCNRDLAELPPGSPCFKLSGVSPSWACIPTHLQLPRKPQGLLSQPKGLSKLPADSRSRWRNWEGESRHPAFPPRSVSSGATGSTPCTNSAWAYSLL